MMGGWGRMETDNPEGTEGEGFIVLPGARLIQASGLRITVQSPNYA
jgi:hypothetical protein